MVRVVRPGGRVVILEITTPSREPLAGFYRQWFDRLVPAVGRLAGRVLRLQLPALERAPLPRGTRAGGRDARLRAAADPLRPAGGWHHRDSRG